LFVRVCLSQVTTIWVKEEKVFQFYSIDSVKWRNIKKLDKGRSHVNGWRRSHVNGWRWSHVTKKTYTACILFFWGHMSHIIITYHHHMSQTSTPSIDLRNRRTRRAVHASA
jgi:hypothetical protein